MKRNAILLAFLLVISGCVKQNKTEFIKIGWIGPLTGSASYYGIMVKNGTELAVEEINNQKGIQKKIELKIEDDQLKPQKGVSILNKFISIDKLQVIIQAAGSGVMLAEAPIAEKSKVVLISPTCSNDKIKYAGEYIFRIWPSDSYQGELWANIIFNKLKKNRAGIISIKNEYGDGLKNEFINNFKKLGGNLVIEESFLPDTTDFRTILVKINEAKPDVVVLSTLYKEAAILLRQAKEIGIKSVFIGTDGNFAPELIELSKGGAEGLLISNMNWNPESNNPLIVKFVTNFKNKFGKAPEVYAAAGYDCMKVIYKAIEEGGYSSDGIKKALYNIKNFNAVTGDITFDEYGEVKKQYDIFEVKNGKFIPYSIK